MPTFRFARLLRFVLLMCAFSVFGINYAEAEEGLASWYSPGLEGKLAESGVPYDLRKWDVPRLDGEYVTQRLVADLRPNAL